MSAIRHEREEGGMEGRAAGGAQQEGKWLTYRPSGYTPKL